MLVAYKLTDNSDLERNKDSLSIQYTIYLTNIPIHFYRCNKIKYLSLIFIEEKIIFLLLDNNLLLIYFNIDNL
jgi:hypothetical protein